MSQSLYITLKQQHPEAIIDVMAPAWCKPILERMPEVNQAIEMPLGHGDFNLLGRRALGKELKKIITIHTLTFARILQNQHLFLGLQGSRFVRVGKVKCVMGY